jgi:hypothetical protein
MAVEEGCFNLPTRNGARVLLSSVFGPYCQDDQYGSRAINPMELFHNQVTREQGSFSLRVFHPSLGIRLIQANISAPCTLLDFPTLEIFEHEITSHHYDIIGISSIVANVGKVKKMCEVVRALSPRSRIVVGGHVAAIPALETMVDADHFVKGEGVEWMRRFLGEDPQAPIRHPAVCSSFGFRFMGLPLPVPRAAMPAVVAPSVGCPMGCDFCCTSAFFGGKGKVHSFFKDGNELFDALCDIDSQLHSSDSSADQFVACCCPILFVKAMGTAASLIFCVRQLGNIRIGSSPHINVPRGWGGRRSVWLLHLRRKV